MTHFGTVNLSFCCFRGTDTKVEIVTKFKKIHAEIQNNLLFTLLGLIGGFIPKLVALVVAFLEFHEVLRFVSLVLLSLVLGVEGQSPAVVDCRRSAGETRVDPLGRGEGRGAPHEIHVGRLQVLGQVLLVHRLGLLLDLAMGGGGVYGEAETKGEGF